MRIALSVPTGFHARELLIPLKPLLEADPEIEKVTCITPGAPYQQQIFPGYSSKFEFVANPKDQASHDELIKKLAPDILVTDTTGLDPNDVPILLAAKHNLVPTLTFIASWDNVWKIGRAHAQNKPQELADQLIVWNQMMKDHLLRIFPDYQAEKITVIGAPRLDYFQHADKIPSREQLFEYLGFKDPTKKLIHFSTTELYPLDYIVKSVHQAAIAGSIKYPVELYASVHPGGNLAKHETLKQYGAAVRYSFGRDDHTPIRDFVYNPSLKDIYMLVALFKHSDLLINHSSTTAIESFLGDTPVINVKYGKPWDIWHWRNSSVYSDFKEHYRDITDENPTKIVKNKRELIQGINDYLEYPEHDREARQRTLKKMITTTNGTASQQVLQLVKRVARST